MRMFTLIIPRVRSCVVDVQQMPLSFSIFNAALMANISLNDYRLPTNEDLNGAITALQRLQETYQLKTSDLASGKLGKAPSLNMNGMKLFQL